MYVNEKECIAAGLVPKEVERIARGISRYAKQAQSLGMHIFGGSGTGTLRFEDDRGFGSLVVASLDGSFDGGDGASQNFGDGLLRGEG